MTLVYGKREFERQDGPHTHVLIIGVGAYQHLDGGADPRPKVTVLGLDQLTSPPKSAQAFARWILETPLNNDAAPLGSVEILLSPTQVFTLSTGREIQIDTAATTQEIIDAFNDWDARCDAHTDNVAIFYFCGHGLEKEDMIILPADFGRNRANPWDNAFNFTRSFAGMAQNKAGTQWYIVDACRQTPPEVLKSIAFGNSRVLKEGSVVGTRARVRPIFLATSLGKQAFGDEDETSRYTACLLDALEGKGALLLGRAPFAVDTNTLGVAVGHLMQHRNSKLKNRSEWQTPFVDGEQSGTTKIHILPGKPIADVVVFCAPNTATPRATLRILNSHRQYCRPPMAGEWEVTVVADQYQVDASFDPGPFHYAKEKDWWLVPPEVRRICLKVQ